jgi:4-amino-4-deoxy-L-arabinose transferase-like glycosyltransferase
MKRLLLLSFLPILIFIVFLFFRLYNLDGRIGFGWDQERDAQTISEILSGNPTLLGPRVQGPSGFFLPPYFFYLLAPFYLLTGGNPFATVIFVGFWSVLFFVVTYFVLSKVFSKTVALIFLALWAVNPLAVSLDSMTWNPVAIPLFVILMIYWIYKFMKVRKTKYLFLIGLTLGFGTSFHVQFLLVALMLVPVVSDLIKKGKILSLFYAIVGFVVPFLPILLFDFRHNFLNTKLIFDFLTNGTVANRVLPVWNNLITSMLGMGSAKYLGLLFYILVALALYLTGKNIKKDIHKKIFDGALFVWLFTIPIFYFFSRNPSEYYFNYLLVPVFLIAAYLINVKKLWGKIVIIFLVALFVFRGTSLFGNAPTGLREKDRAVRFLGDITRGKSAFNVSFKVPANEDAGFRYLLKYYKVGYTGNPIDPLIEFVIPSDKVPTPYVFGNIGVYIPQGWIKDNGIR